MRALSHLLVALSLSLFSVSAGWSQYYEYDREDPGQCAPLREGEKAVIPLDTGDPAYDLWQTPREDLAAGREPGPIDYASHGHAGAQRPDTP